LNLKKFVAERIGRKPEGMKPAMHYLGLSQEVTLMSKKKAAPLIRNVAVSRKA